jgi:hypothetical protein
MLDSPRLTAHPLAERPARQPYDNMAGSDVTSQLHVQSHRCRLVSAGADHDGAFLRRQF